MDWFLSVLGTFLSLISVWFYGNKSNKAPIFALLMCFIWILYDIIYKQYALLIPTLFTVGINIRNLFIMKGSNK